MSAHAKLKPGDLLGGRYRILRMLGQGGMGTVFLAEDVRLPGKQWAVKELRPRWKDRSGFVDEARFLAECSHPGLAGIADFFPPGPDGTCYLIMEFIQGQTLERIFRNEQPFSWMKAVRIALELCGVLAYLHEGRPRPIIYRDLKPSNIMLDGQGRVRLIDFGTARHYDASSDEDTVRLGTLGFAAPEQLQGKQTDARTDLYALGAVLYYLLSGGGFHNRQQAGRGHTSSLQADVPESLARLIINLLEIDPDKRPQRAEEVRKCLLELDPFRESRQITNGVDLSAVGRNRQLIVIGALTPGSGASFISIALARVLNRQRIPHAVAEIPGTQPDLFHTLFGEKKAPGSYLFRAEEIVIAGLALQQGPVWRDGFTEWMPLPPDRPVTGWTPEHIEGLLGSLSPSVVLADIGSAWLDSGTEALCRQASLIVVVSGPSPVHLSRTSATQAWLKLRAFDPEGRKLLLIANRCSDFVGKEDWLRSLPAAPGCRIPEFGSNEVLSSLWRGELFADRPRVLELLSELLEPAAAHIRKRLELPKKSRSVAGRFSRVLGLGRNL